MKIITSLILALSFATSALAEQHIIASATLKANTEIVSTPKVELYLGLEATRRAVIKIDNKQYMFALKSSAFEKDGKYEYSVAISLSDKDEDDFVVSKHGKTSILKPINLFFEKDGANYTAVVNLVPK